jgi:transposase
VGSSKWQGLIFKFSNSGVVLTITRNPGLIAELSPNRNKFPLTFSSSRIVQSHNSEFELVADGLSEPATWMNNLKADLEMPSNALLRHLTITGAAFSPRWQNYNLRFWALWLTNRLKQNVPGLSGASQTRTEPLAVTLSGANVHDIKMLEETLDAIEPIKGVRGRPRKRPHKLHADKAYDSCEKRRALRRRGITPRITRKGIESSEKLGRYRWVVERTHARLNRYRRLKIRYERAAEIHLAFLQLGCALICWNFVQQFC